MGIRIHKVLGWGLTDISYNQDQWQLTDNRINPNGIIMDPYQNAYEGLEAEKNYIEYLKSIKEPDKPDLELIMIDVRQKNLKIYAEKHNGKVTSWDIDSPGRCFSRQHEYGMPNVFVVRPLGYTEWSRFDDMIDWVEETYLKDDPETNAQPWVKELPDNPFPFHGMWMDARTGTNIVHAMKVPPTVIHGLQEGKFTDEVLVKNLGFETLEDLQTYMKPHVPEEIQHLCEFGNAFTTPEVVFELRPLMYCYWS